MPPVSPSPGNGRGSFSTAFSIRGNRVTWSDEKTRMQSATAPGYTGIQGAGLRIDNDADMVSTEEMSYEPPCAKDPTSHDTNSATTSSTVVDAMEVHAYLTDEDYGRSPHSTDTNASCDDGYWTDWLSSVYMDTPPSTDMHDLVFPAPTPVLIPVEEYVIPPLAEVYTPIKERPPPIQAYPPTNEREQPAPHHAVGKSTRKSAKSRSRGKRVCRRAQSPPSNYRRFRYLYVYNGHGRCIRVRRIRRRG